MPQMMSDRQFQMWLRAAYDIGQQDAPLEAFSFQRVQELVHERMDEVIRKEAETAARRDLRAP